MFIFAYSGPLGADCVVFLNTGVTGGAPRLQRFKSRLDQLLLDKTEHCTSEKRMPERSADYQFVKDILL